MRIKLIDSGKNNLVVKFNYKNKDFIYKKYLKKKNYEINYSRYKSETLFINYLRKKNIKNLPSIIKTNKKTEENIFGYIDGKKIKKISKNDILQCINFIKNINKKKTKNSINFKKATEACISIKDHIETAEKRISLLSKYPKNYGIYKKAKYFVSRTLKQKMNEVKKEIVKLYSYREIEKKLNKQDLILSPSDFGFHNVIKKNNKLFFFDFEYAGMDDPVKLMSDFICQPDNKLNKSQANYFYNNIIKALAKKNEIEKRFKAVIFIHRIKWCCVILSEVLNKRYSERRKFAGSNINVKKCYSKAIAYYNQYLNKDNLNFF